MMMIVVKNDSPIVIRNVAALNQRVDGWAALDGLAKRTAAMELVDIMSSSICKKNGASPREAVAKPSPMTGILVFEMLP